MRYAFNGRTITKPTARAMMGAVWVDEGHNAAAWYFSEAHEQSMNGYICRDAIEANVPGLTMRHPNEEGGS